MYVCICHAVTEKQIENAVNSGVDCIRKVRRCLGVGSVCGKCVCHAQQVIKSTQQQIAIDVNYENNTAA
jgi:bacterioferritin-associated ferredoxin